MSLRTPPGLNYHLPWPIESVELPTVTRINRTEIGYRSAASGNVEPASDAARPRRARRKPDADRRREHHRHRFRRLLAHQRRLGLPVQHPQPRTTWCGRWPKADARGDRPHADPAGAGPVRGQIETDVLQARRQILDRYQAGVEITQVQLQKVDPPAAVIESFRDVQRANTDAERMRNEAESYRNDIVPRARGDAARIVAEGRAPRPPRSPQATGQAQRFTAC